jgi:putative ABC transport system permease protein
MPGCDGVVSGRKKIFHIAKANIFKQKSASLSLFIILMIASMLTTVGLSVLLGADKDFRASVDRLNSLHSSLVLSRDMYNPSFEDLIKEDPRVSQYEIKEMIYLPNDNVNYGGEVDIMLFILNLDDPMEISAPKITEQDMTIPRENAVYLPALTKELGFAPGDTFTFNYRNKPFALTVAGFFETNEYSTSNMGQVKVFVPDECYGILRPQLVSSVWIAVRFFDFNDSEQFNVDFASLTDIELIDMIGYLNANLTHNEMLQGPSIISIILIAFALLVIVISLFVIRFRVASDIEDSMHETGTLKASGYTSSQVIACYIVQYGLISLPATLVGIFLSMPVFPLFRLALNSMTGFTWSLSTDIPVGSAAALVLTLILLLMVWGSCRRIKNLPPVQALRGGIAANSFRRNFFPLHTGVGSAQLRLGLKNMFAFIKSYTLVGAVIAVISFSVVVVSVLYMGFVVDRLALAEVVGMETQDITITTTRHTDADAVAADIENLPGVRKTSMLDLTVTLEVDGVITMMNSISSDYDPLENMKAFEGRMPKYDNEIAIPKIFADSLGKVIGDGVTVKAKGVSQEYMITGYFSTVINGGNTSAITLDGYRRLDPNYDRNNICIYLNEGADIESFIDTLTEKYGVINVYKVDENNNFAAAKARAEEKISYYLDLYDIDSVEYAVIYKGEIVLSGSSGGYQIEKIINWREYVVTVLGTYSDITAIMTQVATIASLIVISLILFMTTRVIITKRRREFGIMKATGYTSKQIIRQLAISFMPVAAVGVILGCAVGAVLVDPLMDMLFSTMAVQGAIFTASVPFTVIVGAVILLVTYAAANISARRIKNISVYELISE